MFRRTTTTILLALGLVALFAGPASAGDAYPPPSVGAQVLGDGAIRVTGTGCDPGAAVTASVTPAGGGAVVATGSGTAGSTGAFEIVTTSVGPGQYQVTATCGELVQVLDVTVPGGTAPTSVAQAGALPRTGSDSSLPLAQVGALLIAAGALVFFVSRRRQSASVS